MTPTLMAVQRPRLAQAWQALMWWSRRQVAVATAASLATALIIGIATVLIPNPWFARDIPPVWWNYPVWIITSVLTGMVVATYVGAARTLSDEVHAARESRAGLAGAILAWFAVGCPVCNKIALVLLGYSGALTWFAPVQPFLAVASMVLIGLALIWRLSGEVVCASPATSATVAS